VTVTVYVPSAVEIAFNSVTPPAVTAYDDDGVPDDVMVNAVPDATFVLMTSPPVYVGVSVHVEYGYDNVAAYVNVPTANADVYEIVDVTVESAL
jgi:hypothetical protein